MKAVSVPSGAAPQKIPYLVSDDKSLVRTIYVAETAAGTTKDNAICLVIGG
ncbi:MAG: hypothetical protein LUE99_18040 [Bacteroides sp.]|nr:hypothetical protein [Bacteroides sp.]